MGTFDVHTDVNELVPLRGVEGLAAIGLFTITGSWTSANGRTGFVPDAVVQEYAGPDRDAVERLVAAGLWVRRDGGYELGRGPHNDPDLPLPLWRYGDGDTGGRIFAPDESPNT